ncbi:MAG: magnesium chelatase subunit D family protein [Syntrophobacterales bacterium]|nr:magnesium chelatase subunit D family protein [Syntrophobacterales bacterium]
MERVNFPFTAIVGQELMKRALLLNVVDSSVGGVLIRGERGTAKSTGVRALANLLPPIRVVESCPFQCDPDDLAHLCLFCKERVERGESLPVTERPIRLVNLPIGITEDRLLGTINIEEALKKGKRAFEPGLLAEAHRGILYVDEVNLLNDQIVDLLLDVAASGVNVVEREGISFSHFSRFVLVGTMNPEEGDLRPQLLDRFGLCVTVKRLSSVEERMEVVRRRLAFERDPETFRKAWNDKEANLREVVSKARDLIDKVILTDEVVSLATKISVAMETDGHRAEITMIKAARANAAFEGRISILPEDIQMAAKLSLAHRVKKNPLEKKELDESKIQKILEEHSEKIEKQVSEEWNPTYENPRPREVKEKSSYNSPLSCVTHICKGRLPTLNPVFPFHRLAIGTHPGRRFPFPSRGSYGFSLGTRIPSSHELLKDISIIGTLRAAAPYQKTRSDNGQIVIKFEDFRLKKRFRKTGLTVMLIVDSSASMRTNDRMTITKGIIQALLRDLYLKRDKIGIITFRHINAEVILPITNNMHDACSRIEEIPVGGRTPLALGMDLALRLLTQEKYKNPEATPVIILFSDGRPNVSSFGKDPIDEALEFAKEINRQNIQAIFVDTEQNPMAMGYGYLIAERMGAIYLPIDRLTK